MGRSHTDRSGNDYGYRQYTKNRWGTASDSVDVYVTGEEYDPEYRVGDPIDVSGVSISANAVIPVGVGMHLSVSGEAYDWDDEYVWDSGVQDYVYNTFVINGAYLWQWSSDGGSVDANNNFSASTPGAYTVYTEFDDYAIWADDYNSDAYVEKTINVVNVQIANFKRVPPEKEIMVSVSITGNLSTGNSIHLYTEKAFGEGGATVNPSFITQSTVVRVKGGAIMTGENQGKNMRIFAKCHSQRYLTARAEKLKIG